jgi:hypothetical protein
MKKLDLTNCINNVLVISNFTLLMFLKWCLIMVFM